MVILKQNATLQAKHPKLTSLRNVFWGMTDKYHCVCEWNKRSTLNSLVHREPLYKRYSASLLSGGCCYALIFGFLLIFIPLIIAYNSGGGHCLLGTYSFQLLISFYLSVPGFWLKEDIYYTQPIATYRYENMVQLFGSRYQCLMYAL